MIIEKQSGRGKQLNKLEQLLSKSLQVLLILKPLKENPLAKPLKEQQLQDKPLQVHHVHLVVVVEAQLSP